MSDLSQGQVASLVLNAGDTYRISTTGTATVKVIYGAPAGTTTITSNFATFGPYDAPAKLDVTAVSGAASYSLLAAIPLTKVGEKFSDPSLQALVSGAGNALQTYTIAGSSINAYCHPPQYPAVTFADQGNGVVRVSGTKIAKVFRKGMRLRVGGNAVTQYNQFNALITAHDTSAAVGWFEYSYTGAFSPVVTTLELTPLNEIDLTPTNVTGWGSWLQQALGRNWRCLGNFAMAGGDTEQNVAAFDATHGQVKPKFVLIDVSTNDIYARQWPATRCIAAVSAFVAKCKGIGATPIVMTIAPRSAGVTAPLLAEHMAVNAWLKQNIAALGGILIDVSKATANGVTFCNTSNTSFNPNAGMLFDGVHDDAAGARAKGVTALAPALAPLVPPQASVLLTGAAEAVQAKSLFANTALVASPGTAPVPANGFSSTGVNFPEGVTASRTGAASAVLTTAARTVAADGDAFGNNLTFTCTTTAANEEIRIQFVVAAGSMTAGDIISSALRLKVTGKSNIRQLSIVSRQRYIAEDGLYANKTASVHENAGTAALNDDVSGVIQLPDLRLFAATDSPPTMDSYYLEVVMLSSGAGGATITVAQPSVIKA